MLESDTQLKYFLSSVLTLLNLLKDMLEAAKATEIHIANGLIFGKYYSLIELRLHIFNPYVTFIRNVDPDFLEHFLLLYDFFIDEDVVLLNGYASSKRYWSV